MADKFYDISVPLAPDLQVYPGDPPFERTDLSRIVEGGEFNVSRLSFSAHAGTHIDAPRHGYDEGASVDLLPLSLFIGPALVVQIDKVREISRAVLARANLHRAERVLFKTENSGLWQYPEFRSDYTALTMEGAEYLLEQGVKLVGMDYMSLESYDANGEVHRLLLRHEVAILEGLNLQGVPAGDYELIALPLRVKGGDGAPVRAVLRRREQTATRGEFDAHTTKWPLS